MAPTVSRLGLTVPCARIAADPQQVDVRQCHDGHITHSSSQLLCRFPSEFIDDEPLDFRHS
jgi:hypothetical protein